MAIYWHLMFLTLSISSVAAFGMADEGTLLTMYNYGTTKLVGPISVSYVISIMLFLCIMDKKDIPYRFHLLRYIYNLMLYLAISGNIIGLAGFFFSSGYSFSEYIKLNIYIGMTIITLITVFKTANQQLISLYSHSSVPLICGAIIGTIMGLMAGITTTYGGVVIPMTPDVIYFAPIIIFALFMTKGHVRTLSISSILYIFLLSKTMGGKTVFLIVFTGIYLSYLILFDKNFKITHKKHIVKIRMIFVTAISLIILYIPTVLMDRDSLTSYKIEAAISMFGGDASEVSNSPATRIAEIANFCYNNRYDPFHLIFGMGYGGYFTDELGMLVGLDLSGGWSEEVIRSGRFPNGHDTYAEVPLVNGFLGLILVIYVGLLYIRNIKMNFLSLAAVPWLLLSFYFSPIYAFISIFFLTGAEYNLNKNTEYEKISNEASCYISYK